MKKLLFSILILLCAGHSFAQRQPFATAQFAGSSGYVVLGGGITSVTGKIHNELLFGFVPKAYGGPLNKLTYKFSYYPAQIKMSEKVIWKPVNPTIFIGYNIGKGYSLSPSYRKYDSDYYWWSPALRLHAGVNTAVEIKHGKKDNKTMLYLEANTNDRYITMYYDNVQSINFTDIFFLGAGVKFFIE